MPWVGCAREADVPMRHQLPGVGVAWPRDRFALPECTGAKSQLLSLKFRGNIFYFCIKIYIFMPFLVHLLYVLFQCNFLNSQEREAHVCLCSEQ